MLELGAVCEEGPRPSVKQHLPRFPKRSAHRSLKLARPIYPFNQAIHLTALPETRLFTISALPLQHWPSGSFSANTARQKAICRDMDDVRYSR